MQERVRFDDSVVDVWGRLACPVRASWAVGHGHLCLLAAPSNAIPDVSSQGSCSSVVSPGSSGVISGRKTTSDRMPPRGGERRCRWSPRRLGGLTGGRVRSRDSRGIPKKEAWSLDTGESPVLEYLLYVIRVKGRSPRKHVPLFSTSEIYFSTSSRLVLSFPIKPNAFLTILKIT